MILKLNQEVIPLRIQRKNEKRRSQNSLLSLSNPRESFILRNESIRNDLADDGIYRDRLTKADVEDLWASFNEPDLPVASTSSGQPVVAPKKIKITVSYQFVGETVT